MVLVVVSSFGLFVVLPILIVRTRGRLRSRRYRDSPVQQEARIAVWRDRILHPKPEEIETLRGAFIPQRLLHLYGDTALVLSKNFDISSPPKDSQKDSWHIAEFLPLQAQDQKLTWDLSDDGMGNLYWMEMNSERLNDGTVFLIWHDGWDNEKVADTLEELLSWPRISCDKTA